MASSMVLFQTAFRRISKAKFLAEATRASSASAVFCPPKAGQLVPARDNVAQDEIERKLREDISRRLNTSRLEATPSISFWNPPEAGRLGMPHTDPVKEQRAKQLDEIAQKLREEISWKLNTNDRQ
eukprot:gnl/TRDRNA2_/TRDRNA2_187162_c0_seq1.p2 gnl/TRDRNA2_/TRDRNA2_187162_c0~~gnl/TRDRNA2_/TRDRNA2_187162_c0_seq1.p2  ORF type:complete len:126 (+),score=33.03 gnl/TRDRNA2_/TRDRNA2_187162_c0_seq1:81-458(+)